MADFSDRDALLRACHVGHLAAVRLLLQGASPGVSAAAVDEAGRSALELAASAGHSAVVRLLAEQLEGETWRLGERGNFFREKGMDAGDGKMETLIFGDIEGVIDGVQ